MRTSTTIENISPALLAAQKKIGAAKKEAVNPFFHSNYADLGSVMEACKEALNKNKITVLQPIDSDEHGVYVETTLLHSSGEWISASMRISPKTDSNPQDQGSAISYARRYSLQSMVFIPAEDDDAEKATQSERKKEEQKEVKLATAPQISLINNLLRTKSQSSENLKRKYKVDSLTQLTIVQASEIIGDLKQLPIESTPEIQYTVDELFDEGR